MMNLGDAERRTRNHGALRLALWGPPTLADRIFYPSLIMDAVIIVSGGALIGILAQLTVPLWPVPVTAQSLGVILVALSLGLVRGTLAVLVYLLMGVVGFPVFAAGHSGWDIMMGPTGGYLFGFILTAMIAGAFSRIRWERGFGTAVVAALASSAGSYLIGIPWLAAASGVSLLESLGGGLYALLPGTAIKTIMIAAIMTFAWQALDRLDERAVHNLGEWKNPARPH